MNKKTIQEFIYFKKSTGEIKNQEDFGRKIGYSSKSAFSQAIGKYPLPEELILKINTVYPEFKDWENKNFVKKEGSFNDQYNFSNLSVDDKLNFLSKQNSDLFEENENLKDMIEDLSLKLEISLAPILRHFKLQKDKMENIGQKNSSIN
ncbi:hypothetical protein MKJ01_05405 [Chryseobacterium sp. SSA4.19]|uniref:hypothetical protein n=1 Tax=Chryseobacterium sp. SSA4.19 TaxID=2919915 RepID=UPI001F4D9290|nr:hypothetical protein [Chryseobacterium sp. SSA4.19]MCJ8153197.1 hypothetical protein [Chryseobacterium sp. SSA4.19]